MLSSYVSILSIAVLILLSVEQIKILCEDLRVLGKTEFKQLLK